MKREQRKSWDDYFMSIAQVVSSRSTCNRAHVGSVIVRDKHIISTGYNGSVSGGDHCDERGHILVNGHCVRTVHSELNAILQAAMFGVSTKGCTIYTTHFPCLNCVKSIMNSGIIEIVYCEEYSKYQEELAVAISLIADTDKLTVTKLCAT